MQKRQEEEAGQRWRQLNEARVTDAGDARVVTCGRGRGEKRRESKQKKGRGEAKEKEQDGRGMWRW